ncbi:MAG: hypothetical protein KA712_25740 [Myxococcales bacterium]|nr:hypothetical protein [Myxococcales bacterium]
MRQGTPPRLETRPPSRACAVGLMVLLAAPAGLAGCRSRKVLLPAGEGVAVEVVEHDAGTGGDPGADVVAIAESEPNNFPSQAQLLHLAEAPALELDVEGPPAARQWRVSGTLAGATDVDTFRFRLSQRREASDAAAPDAAEGADAGVEGPTEPAFVVRIALEALPGASAATPLRLDVSNASGATLVRITNTVEGEALVVPNLDIGASSDLLVRVGRGQSPSEEPVPFVLTVSLRSLGAGEEREPNGTPERATVVAVATATAEMAGHLGWRQDTDWFQVRFPSALAGMVIDLDLQLPGDAAAQVGFADAAGTMLYGYQRPASGRLQLAGFQPPGDGVVMVKVQNTAGAITDRRYRLTLAAVPAAPELEQEPNDQLSTAPTRTADALSGRIHPAGDVDVFRFCRPASKSLMVVPPANSTLEIDVLDATGRLVTSETISADRQVTLEGLELPECFFVQVREKSAKRSNFLEPYSLRLTPP